MNIRNSDHGPFDIIGDVHGCYDELLALLDVLGYELRNDGARLRLEHGERRRLIFLGDLVDRGPQTPRVLQLAMDSVAAGSALCVIGNHDDKLARKLRGRNVKIAHGLAESLAQLEHEPPEFQRRAAAFIESLPDHYVLDAGKLVVAHAGLRADMHGRRNGAVRAFCLYGETRGAIDEYGLPVRYDWALDYRGEAAVVYGHTPVLDSRWVNNTICIDNGCVYGGKLTALRYPERELVSVPAARVHYESTKALGQGIAQSRTS